MGCPQQLLRCMRWAGLARLFQLGLRGLYPQIVIQVAKASKRQGQGRFLLYRHQSVCLQH
jgi:hypothetical protein